MCCWLWESPQHPQPTLPRAPSNGPGTLKPSGNREGPKALVAFSLLTCLLPSDQHLSTGETRPCGKVSFSEILVDSHVGD